MWEISNRKGVFKTFGKNAITGLNPPIDLLDNFLGEKSRGLVYAQKGKLHIIQKQKTVQPPPALDRNSAKKTQDTTCPSSIKNSGGGQKGE